MARVKPRHLIPTAAVCLLLAGVVGLCLCGCVSASFDRETVKVVKPGTTVTVTDAKGARTVTVTQPETVTTRTRGGYVDSTQAGGLAAQFVSLVGDSGFLGQVGIGTGGGLLVGLLGMLFQRGAHKAKITHGNDEYAAGVLAGRGSHGPPSGGGA